MNNDKILEIIQSIGVMTDMWIITYTSFMEHDMSSDEAIMYTKALMSSMLESTIGNKNTEEK